MLIPEAELVTPDIPLVQIPKLTSNPDISSALPDLDEIDPVDDDVVFIKQETMEPSRPLNVGPSQPSQPGTSAQLIFSESETKQNEKKKETIGFECDECGKKYAVEDKLETHKIVSCRGE